MSTGGITDNLADNEISHAYFLIFLSNFVRFRRISLYKGSLGD